MIARLVAVDIVAFALLGMAWHRGWVEVLWRADTTYLCAAIALVFAFGWGLSWWNAHRVRGGYIYLKDFPHYVGTIRYIGGLLVMMGLIGTVVGFVIALSGVDPQKAGELSGISGMLAALIEGMGVALYTTLAGAVLSIWLSVKHRILAGGFHG
jgi:hypothetical protein